jgi:N-methylhydantoinase A
MYRIGIDVGGTFTDLSMISEDGEVSFYKTPSTPHDPSEAIISGMAEMLQEQQVSPSEVSHIGHGTTVATNLIIERKGAVVGLITTRGFRDILEIGRQVRPHLYDYNVQKPDVLVPRELRMEVSERVDSDGNVLEVLDEDQVRQATRFLAEKNVGAVTICFLHAYKNPDHERRAKELVLEIMPEAYISLSSDILPEFREYERLSTTVLNATIGPKMSRYLDRFLSRATELGIANEPRTVHSNGGLMSMESVRNYPVRTCLSGPAAGVVGAAIIGAAIGHPDLVTFDVGGTSTDVSLIQQGRAVFTSHRNVAGYPVKTPMVDIHVIGAGGGSIAWRDDAGALKVGPHSAGAVPGPVAYGRGGQEPTITDAEVTLQRLNPHTLLRGKMPVFAAEAKEAIRKQVAEPLSLSIEEAAEGILRIATANMSRAIRSVSTEKGYNLSKFALFAYGGAGPLHAVEVAEECGIPVVIVPQEPGTMCARGVLLADISFDFVKSDISVASAELWDRVMASFSGLVVQANDWLDSENIDAEHRVLRLSIDARYEGQNFEIQIPFPEGTDPTYAYFLEEFQQIHHREYGYKLPARKIHIINLRLQAVGRVVKVSLSERKVDTTLADAYLHSRQVYVNREHGWVEAKVYDRSLMPSDAIVDGPAILEEMSSTTLIGVGHKAEIDAYGNLIIRLGAKDDE